MRLYCDIPRDSYVCVCVYVMLLTQCYTLLEYDELSTRTVRYSTYNPIRGVYEACKMSE